MDDGKKQFSYMIWLIAGLYLIYLAYTIVKNTAELTLPQLLFAGGFVLSGAFFALSGGIRLWKLERKQRALREELEREALEKNPEKDSSETEKRSED